MRSVFITLRALFWFSKNRIYADSIIQCGSGSKKYFCRELGVRWEAACVQHVDVAVQIVQKLDQLIKKFYTGSKLESNSIFIQYLLAKVKDISNKSKNV
jgi:hypothetical protein